MKFTMSYTTSRKDSNAGSVNFHLMPLTFDECLAVLTARLNEGFTINNLTLRRAKG